MGAVDAHAVHALGQQVVDEARVVGGFARHGDHDAHVPARFGRAEQIVGMLLEQMLAVGKVVHRGQVLAGAPLLAGEFVQGFQHGVDGGQHVRFGPAQRGQAEC